MIANKSRAFGCIPSGSQWPSPIIRVKRCHFLCLKAKKVTRENSRKERLPRFPFLFFQFNFNYSVASAFVFYAYSFGDYHLGMKSFLSRRICQPINATSEQKIIITVIQKLNWKTVHGQHLPTLREGCFRPCCLFLVSFFGQAKKLKRSNRMLLEDHQNVVCFIKKLLKKKSR